MNSMKRRGVAGSRHVSVRTGATVACGLDDLEAHAQLVLANPDFVVRQQAHAPVTAPQHAKLPWRHGSGAQ